MTVEQLDIYTEKINFDPLQKFLCKVDQSFHCKWQNKKLAEEKWKWKSLSCVWLSVTPRTMQSIEFSRPEYERG